MHGLKILVTYTTKFQRFKPMYFYTPRLLYSDGYTARPFIGTLGQTRNMGLSADGTGLSPARTYFAYQNVLGVRSRR